jgi:hypothetical protein
MKIKTALCLSLSQRSCFQSSCLRCPPRRTVISPCPLRTAYLALSPEDPVTSVMTEGGGLAPIFGWLVGTGTGAGMALLFVFTGLLAALKGLGGYLFPVVRNAEDILPDHDAVVAEA